MSDTTITIHNVKTGEIEVREMNAAELAQLAADKLVADEIKAAETEKEAAREAAKIKLKALGLTLDDLAALGL